jgi:hypothetical protein
MNWLSDHAYLASWLAIPVAILTAFLQAKKKHFVEIDWFRLIIYFSFLTSLAVVFTPTFDQTARDYAKYLISVLLGVIIVSRKQ